MTLVWSPVTIGGAEESPGDVAMMPHAPERRWGLSDLAILIAATAAGMVVVRSVVAINLPAMMPDPRDPTSRWSIAIIVAMNLTAPVLLALSLALLVIRLRPPRPPLQLLAEDPGFVALAVVALTLAYRLIHFGMRLFAGRNDDPSLAGTHLVWLLSNVAYEVGWNIGVAWFILVLQDKWRWGRSLGLAVGCLWVVAGGGLVLCDLVRMMIRSSIR